jgi:hypothetical protein
MKAPEIFGIVVRSVGLVFAYQTIQSIIGFVNVAGSIAKGSRLFIPYATVLNLILLAAAAVWFLRGAPPLQKLAYPRRDEDSTNRQDAGPTPVS